MQFFDKLKSKGIVLLLLALLVMPLVFVSGGCGGGGDDNDFRKLRTTYRIKPGGEFRVLQLTDIHITGAPENIADIMPEGTQDEKYGISAYQRDMFALETMDAIIKKAKPDFIAITGDLAFVNEQLQKDDPVTGRHYLSIGHNDNLKPIQRFVEKIESYNIPWAFVFGNHDAEGIHGHEELGNYFESLKNCVFEKGPADVDGVGNYIVNVENSNGSLNKALVFIDSNSYIKGNVNLTDLGSYDHIHDNQLDWYERALNAVGQNYGMAEGTLPESFCFWHIPVTEYKAAWDGKDSGDPEIIYEFGINAEGVCHPNLKVNGGGHMFEKMLAVGSTKAVFCGHDHVNNSNIKYKGINLIYGKSIDYAAYAPITTDMFRGGTLIHIKDGGDWNVEQIDYDGNLYKKYLDENGMTGYPKE